MSILLKLKDLEGCNSGCGNVDNICSIKKVVLALHSRVLGVLLLNFYCVATELVLVEI